MIIKDRLIEVDITEALAIAGKGETVRCVGEGTGLIDIVDALEGLTFFAPESALAENPEPIKLEVSKDEIAKLAKSAFVPGGVVRYDTPEPIKLGIEKFEKEIAKLGSAMLSPGPAHFDTPENRTRAIIDSVERYDEEHGDPPTTRQDTEDAAEDVPKQEAPKTEAPKKAKEPKEVPGFVPFALAPSGGGVEEMTSGKIKINGHNRKPDSAEAPAVIKNDPRRLTIEWTDDMLGVLGAMRYTTTANGERTTKWSLDRLRTYFKCTYDDVSYGLELYQMDEKRYDAAAEKYILPDVRAGRAAWTSIKKKEEENT